MNPWIVLPAIVALGVVYVMAPFGLESFFGYRRRKLVLCPMEGEPAQIQIDARRAGVSAAFGHPSLKVESCSLWPERRECKRQCLRLPKAEMYDIPVSARAA